MNSYPTQSYKIGSEVFTVVTTNIVILGMLRHVVWKKYTDVSEEYSAPFSGPRKQMLAACTCWLLACITLQP